MATTTKKTKTWDDLRKEDGSAVLYCTDCDKSTSGDPGKLWVCKFGQCDDCVNTKKKNMSECFECGKIECDPSCNLNRCYADVEKAIIEGRVTEKEFNALLEAQTKSAIERASRRTRIQKMAPTKAAMSDRVTPRLAGRNDPPRQGRGKRFASGTPQKIKQNLKQKRDAAMEGFWDTLDKSVVAFLCENGGKKINESLSGETLSNIRAVCGRMPRDKRFRNVFESKNGHIPDNWLYEVVRHNPLVNESSHARYISETVVNEKFVRHQGEPKWGDLPTERGMPDQLSGKLGKFAMKSKGTGLSLDYYNTAIESLVGLAKRQPKHAKALVQMAKDLHAMLGKSKQKPMVDKKPQRSVG